MKKYMRYIAPILITGIFVLAVWLLYSKLRAYSIDQIRESMSHIPNVRLALCLLLAAVNYVILIGYDWLALKAIHKTLPFSRVSLVSFVGQAVSYNFGALLGGTSVRFRFYSVWGFSIHEIVHLVLMLAVTFWVGALGLAGVVFIIAPPVFPPELMAKMPLQDVRILGYILTAVAALYLVLCFSIRHTVHIFGKEMVFPTPRIAIAQVIVAWVDLICAAACMWVLLPSALHVDFLDFLPGYLMAQVAVVLTHIPGGVGLFELIIIHLTHTTEEQVVFAAVLIFRLVYYILPLLLAAVVLCIYEYRVRRNFLRDVGRWIKLKAPTGAAIISLIAGAFLLMGAFAPIRLVPLSFASGWAEAVGLFGRMGTAIAGAALVLLPYGLVRRQRLPLRLTVIAALLGICASFAGGGSLLQVVACLLVCLACCAAHHLCRRKSFYLHSPIPGSWIVVMIMIAALSEGLRFFLASSSGAEIAHMLSSSAGYLPAAGTFMPEAAAGAIVVIWLLTHLFTRRLG